MSAGRGSGCLFELTGYVSTEMIVFQTPRWLGGSRWWSLVAPGGALGDRGWPLGTLLVALGGSSVAPGEPFFALYIPRGVLGAPFVPPGGFLEWFWVHLSFDRLCVN